MRHGTPTEPVTGLYTPLGATRPCILIREADAIVFAADLTKAMRHYSGPVTTARKISELIDLLEKVKS